MPNHNPAAIFKGTPYLSPYGVNALESLGNTSKLSYSVDLDEKELPDFETPGGGVDTKLVRVKAAKVNLSLRKVKISNLALAFGGDAAAFTGGAVAAEAHTAGAASCLVVLDFPQDMTKELTVTPEAGGPAYEEGVDYQRVRAGIIPLEGGAIDVDDAVKVAYTKLAGHKIEGLINLNRDFHLLFDGINEVDDAPFLGEFYKVKFGPAKGVEFIGDDFVSLDLEGTVQKDETKIGTGVSKYMNLRTGF
jgi:hypothetical protein